MARPDAATAITIYPFEREKRMQKIGFLLLFIPLPGLSHTLCDRDETAVFSCEIGSKSLSVCLQGKDSLTYRYGQGGAIELELNSAVFSSAMCSGGGISRLRFSNGDYDYVVYDRLCRGTDEAGLHVLKNGNLLADKSCSAFSEEIFGINSALIDGVDKEPFDHTLTSQ